MQEARGSKTNLLTRSITPEQDNVKRERKFSLELTKLYVYDHAAETYDAFISYAKGPDSPIAVSFRVKKKMDGS